MLPDAYPGVRLKAPSDDEGIDCSVHLHVDDADAMAARAVAARDDANAAYRRFCRDRSCRLRDQFGHTCSSDMISRR